jgi:hypothetical protein
MKEYKKSLELLASYAENLGYKIIETDCDSWDYHTKTICNNKRRTLENRVIYMIHEVGHAARYEKNKDTYFQIHPGLNSGCDIKKKVSEIEHEALAWNDGLEIARKLKIPVNQNKFAQIKTRCIQSYL